MSLRNLGIDELRPFQLKCEEDEPSAAHQRSFGLFRSDCEAPVKAAALGGRASIF